MKRYTINFEKLRELLKEESLTENKETEIIESFEVDENSDEIRMQNKTQREIKSFGDKENNAMIYDVVRILFDTLLSSNSRNIKTYNLSEQISFYTLVQYGVLEENNEINTNNHE